MGTILIKYFLWYFFEEKRTETLKDPGMSLCQAQGNYRYDNII